MRMLLLMVWLAGCGGDRPTGEACRSGRDCESGLCGAFPGEEKQQCTESCSDSDDCPDGWSCGGTLGNVLVCKPGPATPLGY